MRGGRGGAPHMAGVAMRLSICVLVVLVPTLLVHHTGDCQTAIFTCKDGSLAVAYQGVIKCGSATSYQGSGLEQV